ncbi:hypothetical protein A8H39_00805 [Paraburkholderia fungorum]|uniref:hypothetical protein n=1 Tax=Paraburkholderia fungorum TaxID=134537 RepID=UPI00048018FE|nr:hypothetical protein [Paraburkholderia fungorum]PNE59719.1 hypothetical protein A8H39_00805 [Paraburkholderia fungorum]
MKKGFLACALAVVSLTSMAEAPGYGHYDVKLLKDGREIFVGDTSLNTPVPLLYRDGHEVSEVACTHSSGMKSMKAEQRFIGVAVRVARRADDPRQAEVEIEDTHLLSMDKSSDGDCASLTAKTDGLPNTKLSVRLPVENETVNVPVSGGRYSLEITHRID